MSLINGMQALKDEISASRLRRKRGLKAVREDTKQIRQETRQAISDFEKTRKAETETLERKLASFTSDLTRDVGALRSEFRQDSANVRSELVTASAIWHGKAAVEKEEQQTPKRNKRNKKVSGKDE